MTAPSPVRRWATLSAAAVTAWLAVVYLIDQGDWSTLFVLAVAALFYWLGRPPKGS